MNLRANNKLNSIQLLRAIAVMLVVYAHVADLQPDNALRNFFYWQNFGAVGVDIFFVISGFIITVIAAPYAANRQGWYFLVKRMVRVIPLYWLVSTLSMLLYYFHAHQLFQTPAIIKTFVIFPFFENGLFVDPVITQGWTLSFEMLFYTVAAFSIMLAPKKYIVLTTVIFLLTIAVRYGIGNRYTMLTFVGNGIMIEFLLGAAAGQLFLSRRSISVMACNVLVIIAVLLLLATMLLGYNNISEMAFTENGSLSLQRSFLWGLPSFLLVTGFAMREKHRLIRIPAFWLAIGNASYSIYLTHILVLASFYVRWNNWGVSNIINPELQMLLSLSVAIAAGYVFYRMVEKPLLRQIADLLKPLKTRFTKQEI